MTFRLCCNYCQGCSRRRSRKRCPLQEAKALTISSSAHRNGRLYVFETNLRDITCIHGPHMYDTTSHRNGGLYVLNKHLRGVTSIHRLHMEDTTSHRNGGLYVFLKSLNDVTGIRRLHTEDTTSAKRFFDFLGACPSRTNLPGLPYAPRWEGRECLL